MCTRADCTCRHGEPDIEPLLSTTAMKSEGFWCELPFPETQGELADVCCGVVLAHDGGRGRLTTRVSVVVVAVVVLVVAAAVVC